MTDDILQPLVSPPAPPIQAPAKLHPLDRADDDGQALAAESARIRLAWAKLIWLLSFLGVLLALSYMIPYIAERTQYAITRGKQRAEYDFARDHIGESPIADMSRAYQMVSQVVSPSVVHINTTGSEMSAILPLANRTRTRIPAEGQGSGIIMEASGYILTNNHVIKGANEISVSLANGDKAKARVVGRDAQSDLAVLKIEAENLIPATFGDSESVEPGALVWAVGSPFGLERTITSGILSAKNRAGLAGNSQQNFLQTDAAVNPGNSGGPLVDAGGKVIGVNTAIVGESYQGISFAIPSNVAREIYKQLINNDAGNRVHRGWLGVSLKEMNPELARQAGVSSSTGVYIAGIYLNDNKSPAADAGIQPGDVLLRWNGTAVNSPADLRVLVEKTPISSRATVVVSRGGQELSLEVVVGDRPQLD